MAAKDQLAACPSAAPTMADASSSSVGSEVGPSKPLPASSNSTDRSGFSVNRAASAHPAEPAPTMTTSKWFTARWRRSTVRASMATVTLQLMKARPSACCSSALGLPAIAWFNSEPGDLVDEVVDDARPLVAGQLGAGAELVVVEELVDGVGALTEIDDRVDRGVAGRRRIGRVVGVGSVSLSDGVVSDVAMPHLSLRYLSKSSPAVLADLSSSISFLPSSRRRHLGDVVVVVLQQRLELLLLRQQLAWPCRRCLSEPWPTAALNESIAAAELELDLGGVGRVEGVECVVVVLGGLGELAERIALAGRCGYAIAAAACGQPQCDDRRQDQ